jgi:hypothetical protein
VVRTIGVQNYNVHTSSPLPISHTQPRTCVFSLPTLHVCVLTPIYARVCSRNLKRAQAMAESSAAAKSKGSGFGAGSKGGSYGAGSASKAGNALGSNKTPLAFPRPTKAQSRKGKEPANTELEILGELSKWCGTAQPTRALPTLTPLHVRTPLRVRTRGRMYARDATPQLDNCHHSNYHRA